MQAGMPTPRERGAGHGYPLQARTGLFDLGHPHQVTGPILRERLVPTGDLDG